MLRPLRVSAFLASATLLIALAPTALQAQATLVPARPNVVSANPFGLLLDVFNAEYERAINNSFTAGIGGSSWPFDYDEDMDGEPDDTNLFNVDVFGRFYPSGVAFDGWAFGAKVGYTERLGVGIGFDVNRSWLLGSNENFYVGIGLGLKRILDSDGEDLKFFPTIRLINVGFAF